ncbi:MAG: MerR family transcriptional regulator [Gammaproteobacteria bacterium]|nr:MerR family transcriptional regulator [Gammaproteobacteria bacterium]
MLTVSNLAKRFRVSRATILYYERQGLLQPACRSNNGYRWYGDSEVERFENIMAYRSFGVPVADIPSLIEQNKGDSHEEILRRQFSSLEREIQKLRRQQRAIVNFLEHPELLEEKMVTKERWIEIMRAAGMEDDDMRNWHRQFEKLEPEAHQEFLQSLNIDAAEIKKIREYARS